jgi:hypothetical protein
MASPKMAVYTVPNPVPDYVAGVEAMVNDDQDADRRKDLTLCYVCMQWSCDGPDCHRPGICEAQDLA